MQNKIIVIICIVVIMVALLYFLGCFDKSKEIKNPIPYPRSINIFKWIMFVVGVGCYIAAALITC